MSSQITTAFVQQYKNMIFHLSQQKGSRLSNAVRNEMQQGKSAFYERLGAAVAQLRVSRHADTPQIDSAHSRRMVTMADYDWADLIDQEDRIRLLIDPTSPYSQAAMWAMGRAKDDVLIAALGGNAYSGETGTTTVALPAAQKVLAAADGTPGTPTHMNIATLRNAKRILDSNDVDESIPRFCAITAIQLQDLLKQTEVTSSDYAAVKALVQGEIDSFLGFKFIRTQRLVTATVTYDTSSGAVGSGGGSLSAARLCYAWAQDGMLLSTGKEMNAKIDQRIDKNYATQVFASMSVGATRLEEEKVVQIVCSEA